MMFAVTYNYMHVDVIQSHTDNMESVIKFVASVETLVPFYREILTLFFGCFIRCRCILNPA